MEIILNAGWLTTALVLWYITREQSMMFGRIAKIGYAVSFFIFVSSFSNILRTYAGQHQ